MSIRIIARLDVKPPHLVKPIHFEGLRKIGNPVDATLAYYLGGADEIFYLDIVASLYRRNIIHELIADTARASFVPFGAGGGVRTVEDFADLFMNGADKVILNTHALQEEPELIDRAAKIFGSQAVVVHVEAKRWDRWWECFTDCGRVRSGKNVIAWVKEAEARGAGEILLSSVDRDGLRKGFDIPLVSEVVGSLSIPVVAASGAGTLEHIFEVADRCRPDGIAVASILAYGGITVNDIKVYLRSKNVEVF